MLPIARVIHNIQQDMTKNSPYYYDGTSNTETKQQHHCNLTTQHTLFDLGMTKDSLAGTKLHFPFKLHCMLFEVEQHQQQQHQAGLGGAGGCSSIVSWLPNGNAFKVHDKAKFVSLIMPQYFYSTQFKSFQRNLNLWGFESVRRGPNKGACFHRYFVRGQPDLCHRMTRHQAIKSSQAKQESSTSTSSSLNEASKVTFCSEKDIKSSSASGSQTPAQPFSSSALAAESSSCSRSTSFFEKLHYILSQDEYKDIIGWMPHGRSFRILDSNKFVESVGPKYFGGNDCKFNFHAFSQLLKDAGFKQKQSACYYHEVSKNE